MSSASPPRIREESLAPPASLERSDEESPPKILSLDLRSLALFRIALGTVVLCDLISCIPEIDPFYTDQGILPRDALITRFSHPWAMSIHLMSGEWVIQLALSLIGVVALLGMILGYRTRLSTFVAWFLVSSMQSRNPVILHGGDGLIRLLLFWSMFAPLNGRWSLDSLLNHSQPPLQVANASWGTQALMLQVCFVYWFTAAWKWHPIWTTQGSAIYYALSLDQFAKPLGKFLLQHPDIMQAMTHGTMALELGGPFLLFVPIWTARIRLFVVLSFIAFHAGIGLSMALGTFPWVCFAAWMMFVPTLVWERLGASARGRWYSLMPIAGRLRRLALSRLTPTQPPRGRTGPVASVFVVGCSLIVYAGNFLALPYVGGRLPLPLLRVASIAGLGQKWSLFAPYPSTGDGWYQIVGVRNDGWRVDVWNGGTPSEAKPADVAKTYRDSKWRKYLINLSFDNFSAHRPYFGRYLCRDWNEHHSAAEQVDWIDVNYFREPTPPPGKPLPKPEKVMLWHQHCSDQARHD